MKLTLTAAVAVAALTVSPAQATLVGLYKFDSAVNLGLDSSVLGNDLINYGGNYTTGQSGGGLALDGSSALSTEGGLVPSMFPLGGSSYTISADFNTTDTGGAAGIIGWGAYGTNNAVNALRLYGPGTGLLNYWWANDLLIWAGTSDGEWHNVRVSFDGTTRRIFFDGVLSGSDTPGLPNVQDANFTIGVTNGSEYFTGTLDNIAVFNSAVVPEPAAWLLMIAGFGLVGVAARRRAGGVAA